MRNQDITEQFLVAMDSLMRSDPHKRFGQYSKGEMSILNYLFISAQHNGVAPNELSDWMHISTARTAAILNRLEQKGMITRTPDEYDRRRVIVSITKKGRSRIDAERQAVREHAGEILEALGEDDAQALVRIIRRIADIEQLENQEVLNKGGNANETI